MRRLRLREVKWLFQDSHLVEEPGLDLEERSVESHSIKSSENMLKSPVRVLENNILATFLVSFR